jgi:hypothetical protein
MRNRLTPRVPVARPARWAEPRRRATMMAPSVGTIWFPTPTKAWAAARSRVFRLTMLGGAGTRRPSRAALSVIGNFAARTTLSVETGECSLPPRVCPRPPARRYGPPASCWCPVIRDSGSSAVRRRWLAFRSGPSRSRCRPSPARRRSSDWMREVEAASPAPPSSTQAVDSIGILADRPQRT